MRKFIIQLLFGFDELATRTFDLVQARRQAVQTHKKRQRIAAKLAATSAALDGIVADYQNARTNLHSAYELKLD